MPAHIPRIYQNEALSLGDEVALDAHASHHIAKVLRAEVGSTLIIFNGQNGEFLARITNIQKKAVFARIEFAGSDSRESSLSIHIAQCISHGEKMDLTIQKAVELGVHAITPLLSQNASIKKKGELLQKKCSHWERVIISAAEQSGRTKLPALHAPMQLSDFVSSAVSNQTTLALLPAADQTIHSLGPISSMHMTLLIGPESGFSPDEIQTIHQSTLIPVRLGPRTLRTETAGIVAVSILQYLYGDLQ